MYIYLVTHFFRRRLRVRTTMEVYTQLAANPRLIYEDIERLREGRNPRHLTPYQCRRIDNYNSDRDYFDAVYADINDII